METKTNQERFLAMAPLTRGEKRFMAKAYPLPPDAQGKPRYIVKDPEGNEVDLKPEEQALFNQLIFGKPEPEDVVKVSQLKKPVRRR